MSKVILLLLQMFTADITLAGCRLNMLNNFRVLNTKGTEHVKILEVCLHCTCLRYYFHIYIFHKEEEQFKV